MDVDADGNFSFEIGPVPDIAAIVTRDYQLDADVGPPGHLEHRGARGPGPDPARRRGDRGGAPGLGGVAEDDVHDHPADDRRPRRGAADRGPRDRERRQHDGRRPTRCRTPTSAGPPATRATRSAATTWPRTRRWSSRTDRRPCGSGASCVWNQYMANHSRRRRPDVGQRRLRRAQRRRHGDGRDQPRPVGAPQRADDDGLPARQPGVPLVPAGLGARAARGRRW